MFNVRVNNIEFKYSNTNKKFEFVKWYPNTYYESEDKLISEGYEKITSKDGSWKMTKDYHSVHMSCFEHPESCYVIAWLTYDDDEDCSDLLTVGNRLLDLNKTEREDFFRVYEIAEEFIRLANKEKSEE